MLSAVKRSRILAEYTGIDESVYTTLPESRSVMELQKLLKEFQVIIAVLLKGNPGLLLSLIKKYDKDLIDEDVLFSNINALLEFGKLYEQLSAQDKHQVDQKEVQQELRHFWRIMGIDAVIGDQAPQIKKVTGEIEEIRQICGNLERCALVVDERRKIHNPDSDNIIINKSASPEANIVTMGDGLVITRKNSPWTGMYLSALDGDQQHLKSLGLLFERLILKYSLEVATILFDYYIAMTDSGTTQQYRFIAWEEFVDNDSRQVKYYLSGNFQIIHLAKPVDYVHTVIEVRQPQTKMLLGKINDTQYEHGQFTLNPGDSLLMVDLFNVAGEYKNITGESFEACINEANDASKIDPVSNIRSAITTVGKNKQSAVINTAVGRAVKHEKIEINKKALQSKLSPLFDFIDELPPEKKVRISLEGGHIHADREIGAVQIEGMRVAGLVSSLLKERYQDRITVVHQPMVDDDHVVNRLSYTKYRNHALDNNFPIDELIFESSPLIRQVAFDILAELIANQNTAESDYKIERRGDNLYMSLGDDRFVELLEDVEGECTVGCVLFDSGLTVYRRYRQAIRQVYLDRLKQSVGDEDYGKLQDIHSYQEHLYNNIKLADERHAAFTSEFRRLRSDLNNKPEAESLSYIAGLKADTEGDYTIIVNVLEGFYQAQQNKLGALLKALRIHPSLWTLSFDEYGNLELNNNHAAYRVGE